MSSSTFRRQDMQYGPQGAPAGVLKSPARQVEDAIVSISQTPREETAAAAMAGASTPDSSSAVSLFCVLHLQVQGFALAQQDLSRQIICPASGTLLPRIEIELPAWVTRQVDFERWLREPTSDP